MSGLPFEARLHLRDQLRAARALVLKDAEAFDAVVQVVERIGRLLRPKETGMAKFKDAVCAVASASSLAKDVPDAFPEVHARFDTLYELVREARNSAIHEGALARNLTGRTIELALILEDALMPDAATVSDFMIRGPVTAAPWQPLSFVRQTLLANSFSYLPVRFGDEPWFLVSDYALANYLAADSRARLRETMSHAKAQGLALDRPLTVRSGEAIDGLRKTVTSMPILVTREDGELLGIITAFDLL